MLILFAVLTIGFVVDMVFMAKDLASEAPHPTAYIVSAVAIILILAMILMVKLGTYYIITDSQLIISYSLFKIKINLSDILTIRHSKKQALTLMYYKVYTKEGEEQVNYCAICTPPHLLQSFCEELRSANSQIIYEEFDKDGETND